jgi:hypothetical protein
MPVVDGERVDAGDLWLRILTEEKYIRKGKVHHSAFTGRGVFTRKEPSAERPWSLEISGRLRSGCQNVEAEAKAFCDELSGRLNQKKQFAGIMFCDVNVAGSVTNKIDSHIYFTPRDGDRAHADFTFANATDDDLDFLRTWLHGKVSGLHPAQMHLFSTLPVASPNENMIKRWWHSVRDRFLKSLGRT